MCNICPRCIASFWYIFWILVETLNICTTWVLTTHAFLCQIVDCNSLKSLLWNHKYMYVQTILTTVHQDEYIYMKVAESPNNLNEWVSWAQIQTFCCISCLAFWTGPEYMSKLMPCLRVSRTPQLEWSLITDRSSKVCTSNARRIIFSREEIQSFHFQSSFVLLY